MARGVDTVAPAADTAATEQSGCLVGTDRVAPTDVYGRGRRP
jgi:hypothetical protein